MTTITVENVKFNGVTENAAVLKDSGGFKTLILTDNLSAADRAILDAFVALYGSNPLSGDTAGTLTAVYPAATVGGTATGLSSVAAATAGVATINIGGDKAGGDASGLSSDVGVAGSQTVNLDGSPVGATATGLFGGTAATAGRQSVTWTGLVGASATGLLNDATVYTASITIDGVLKSVSVVGSDAQTFTTLVSEINTDLAGAGTASIFSSTELRVVSATTGAASTVAIVDGTLFMALTGFGAIQTAVPGVAVVPATTYTATIVVDGVSKSISVVGSAALTFTTLLAEINTDLGVSAVASLAAGDLKVTSATLGTTSTIRITAGTLFPALTGYIGIFPPADGDSTARTYTAVVEVDGVLKSVSFAGTAGGTLTNVLTELNTDLGASATASIFGGNLIITSSSVGAQSTVNVYDSGSLFSSLTGYVDITTVPGTGVRVYTASATVDGVVIPIAVQGSAAQTFTALLSELNTDLGVAAVASLSAGSVVITSATTGLTSTVSMVDGDLFRSIAGFGGFTTLGGAADLVDEMKKVKVGAATLFDEFDVKVVGAKPAMPPVPATLPLTQAFTYYGGSPLKWRYLENDAVVNP